MTPAKKTWTFFVPLTGLDLTESATLTDRPLFGDATLVSGASLASLFGPEPAFQRRPSTAYIAVRRKHPIRRDPLDFADYACNRAFLRIAQERAREIAAMFTVLLVSYTDEGRLVGLLDQEHWHQQRMHMYCVDDGYAMEWQGRGRTTDTFTGSDLDDLRLSRTDIDTLFAQPPYAALVRLFSQAGKGTNMPIRRTVIDATVQLAAAVHGGTYINQLLSAVICLDMLLSTDAGTSFDEKKRRLRTLIGDALYAEYAVDTVLQSRHKYVHEGQEVHDRAFPLRAIGIATAALYRYAALTDHFTSKASLLACLDLARTAPTIPDPWMVALGKDVQILLAPASAVPPLALFDYIQRALESDEADTAGLDNGDESDDW